MSDEIEVRELKTKDLFTVAKILLSLSDEALDEITELVARKDLEEQKSEEEDEVEEFEKRKQKNQLGMQMATSVIRIMLENAEDDLIAWFADLTGMSEDEFLNARIDAPMVVIDEISKQEGFTNFSRKAFSLYKRMNSSAKQLNEN